MNTMMSVTIAAITLATGCTVISNLEPVVTSLKSWSSRNASAVACKTYGTDIVVHRSDLSRLLAATRTSNPNFVLRYCRNVGMGNGFLLIHPADYEMLTSASR